MTPRGAASIKQYCIKVYFEISKITLTISLKFAIWMCLGMKCSQVASLRKRVFGAKLYCLGTIVYRRYFSLFWSDFRDPNKPVKVPFKWAPATSSQTMEYLDIDVEPTMKRELVAHSRYWETLPLWHKVKHQRFVDEL